MVLTLKKSIIFLLIILFVGGFLRFYKLGNQSFIADEYLGINISYGYYKTGNWVTWDFNQNQPTTEQRTRANIYNWQVAETFKFLDANEQNARVVSVIWGLIGILLIFFLSYFLFKNPAVSLISSALLAVSISALMFDRKLRMYSMFAPTYFLLSFFVYKFLESKPSARFLTSLFEKLYKITNLNWQYFIPAVVVGLVSLNTHLLTANIFITIFVYMLVMAVLTFKKEKTLRNKYTALMALFLIAFFFIARISIFEEALVYFSYNIWNWSYLQKVTLDYSSGILAATFFVLGAIYLIKKNQKAGLWTVLSFLVPLILAVYVWKRNAGHQYIYFTEPFKALIIAAGVFFFADKISEKFFSRKYILAFWTTVLYAVLVLINIPFFFSLDSFYISPDKWNYPNYREAYGYYLKKREASDVLVTRKLNLFNVRGSNSKVLIYGDENKLTLDRILAAQQQARRMWFIGVKYTAINGDAEDYIAKNTKVIKTKYTNDDLQILLWEKPAEESQ